MIYANNDFVTIYLHPTNKRIEVQNTLPLRKSKLKET